MLEQSLHGCVVNMEAHCCPPRASELCSSLEREENYSIAAKRVEEKSKGHVH